MQTITTGSDFSGVGAFDYAINRVTADKGFKVETVFACDMDKYARKAYISTHGEPKYYPENVYNREIPQEPLDVYMTSPPCQSFSLAGKRLGKDDERGVLFFNSHEFIQENKPRFFIFENVKGLLSDDDGKTFSEWVNMLAGKSVNGLPIMFPYENSVPYHIYWKVLNSKKHGVPQNRERVFIIGIRDDEDNQFTWPKEEALTKKLKDILETEVDEKYFLSDKMVSQLLDNGTETDHLIPGIKVVEDGKGFRQTEDNNCPTIPAREEGSGQPVVAIPSVIQINPCTRSGGKQPYQQDRIYDTKGVSPALCRDKSDLCIPVLTLDRPEKRKNGLSKEDGDPSFTLTAQDKHSIYDGFRIRRLTPLECFRLMDFPDTHVQKCKDAGISDSQLYKQAGNSIVVRVLELILDRLKLVK